MLHPSEPSSRPLEASLRSNISKHPVLTGEQYQHRGSSTPVDPKKGIWQWITFKEVVFVFLLCSSGAVLFRSKDSVQFNTIWKENIHSGHFANSKFPVEDEKM